MEILRELDVYLSREDAQLFRVVSNSKFVLVGGKWYEKKSKRILATVLSAILIWNTCGWQPQALAADSLQRIGAETEADDTAETAEKEAVLRKSALKASPSNAEAKDNRGESGTNKAEAESGADAGKAEAGADADTGKAEADAGADKAEAGANGAPNGTATGGGRDKSISGAG